MTTFVRKKKIPQGHWQIKENCQLEALKYESRTEFFKSNASAYNAALDNEWLDEISTHMPEIKKPNGHWNIKENCIKEALKYDSPENFETGNGGAYAGALRNSWLNDCYVHMPNKRKSPGFWGNKENCKLEALKYNNRTTFQRESSGAYDSALVNQWLDEICIHMSIHTNSSTAEKNLFAIVKEKYPSAKKIRDCKVKIKDKPYIQRFDIDIFIPELNLGIEYDGLYYHSFKGLKRGRKNWSDEDLRNYHQIKDNWFLSSKGIKLLHIDESDWIKNKQACIDRCFDFLESNKNV